MNDKWLNHDTISWSQLEPVEAYRRSHALKSVARRYIEEDTIRRRCNNISSHDRRRSVASMAPYF